jgi:hypothetical protein
LHDYRAVLAVLQPRKAVDILDVLLQMSRGTQKNARGMRRTYVPARGHGAFSPTMHFN